MSALWSVFAFWSAFPVFLYCRQENSDVCGTVKSKKKNSGGFLAGSIGIYQKLSLELVHTDTLYQGLSIYRLQRGWHGGGMVSVTEACDKGEGEAGSICLFQRDFYMFMDFS